VSFVADIILIAVGLVLYLCAGISEVGRVPALAAVLKILGIVLLVVGVLLLLIDVIFFAVG
jgi:predicted membrane channel-forming protein YqfA (hemolysin III family)